VNSDRTGILQSGADAMFKADGSWSKVKNPELTRSVAEMAALFSYKFFAEDRSKGAHNMPYTVQIFVGSIGALDTNFDDSVRPQ